MKIEYTSGCIVNRITIDGEDFQDLSAWKLGALKDKVVIFLNATELSDENLQDLVVWIAERYGTCEYEGTCEQCGDSIFTETLNI